MLVVRICCGPYESLSYLVIEGEEAFLVDAGPPTEILLETVEAEGVDLKFVLITHGHYDHLTGLAGLQDSLDVPAYAHPLEVDFFKEVWPYGLEPPELAPLPDRISLSGLVVEPIHTPGHTPGSTCYYLRDHKVLFTGDTLFAGAVGRTDFRGGNEEELRRSLKLLLKLPREVKVLPGHGEPTTLERELPLITSIALP